jgi:hypothetical protein
MAIKAKLGAGVWDWLICQECDHSWTAPDLDLEWTDDPERDLNDTCPTCGSSNVVREERG